MAAATRFVAAAISAAGTLACPAMPFVPSSRWASGGLADLHPADAKNGIADRRAFVARAARRYSKIDSGQWAVTM